MGRVAWSASLEGLSIHVPTMIDLDNHDREFAVLDGIDDAVDALADTVAVMPRKLLDPGGTRIIAKRLDPFDDSLAILFSGDRLDLLHGGWLDDNIISCHAASDP